MVADVFSQKTLSMGTFSFLRVSKRPSAREFQTLVYQGMKFWFLDKDGEMASFKIKSTFVE